MSFLLDEYLDRELELIRVPLRLAVLFFTDRVEHLVDRQDFSNLVDELLEDSRFHELFFSLLQTAGKHAPEVFKAEDKDREWNRRFLELIRTYDDLTLLRRAEEGLSLDARLLTAFDLFLDRGLFDFREVAPNLLGFVDDPNLHPTLALAILDGLRHAICALLLTGILVRKTRPRPWLMQSLVELWLSTKKTHLKLLASLLGEAFPSEERFDLEALQAQQDRVNKGYEALVSEAVRLGASVYPPFRADADPPQEI